MLQGFSCWTNVFLFILIISVAIYQPILKPSLIIFLFTIVNDTNKCYETLSNHLCIIGNWAYQQKMFFNPDRPKQTKEAICPILFSDSSPVIKTASLKDQGLISDEQLHFKEQIFYTPRFKLW